MNTLISRIRVEPSYTGHGFSVEFNDKSFWFGTKHFAELFADKISRDENFLIEVMDHQNNHNWEKCIPQACKGKLWQLIQGIN